MQSGCEHFSKRERPGFCLLLWTAAKCQVPREISLLQYSLSVHQLLAPYQLQPVTGSNSKGYNNSGWQGEVEVGGWEQQGGDRTRENKNKLYSFGHVQSQYYYNIL